MSRIRIAITGATGFLGSHLVEVFHREGHDVLAVVRPTADTAFLASIDVERRRATLEEPDALADAFRGAEVVVHAAAKVHTHGSWRQFSATTITGTHHALEAAIVAQVRRFVLISTVGVYGFPRPDGLPFDESAPYGNILRWNYYSRSKIEAEKIVRNAHQEGRIATTIVRPTWVYGPRDTTTLPRVAEALRGHHMKWIGDGSNKLSLIYVTDLARSILLAATDSRADGGIYNIAADETSPTQREFVTRICELLELPLPSASVPYRVAYGIGFAGECISHLTGYRLCPPLTRLTALLFGGERRFSSQRIQKELDWQPAVPFEDGIRRTAEWYRSQSQS